ncbi:MAG: response regulator, partial [bacterium]
DRISFINKRGREILGHKEGSFMGKNWVDFFIPENKKDKVRATFEKLKNGEVGRLAYMEYPVLTSSGKEHFMAWHNTALIKGGDTTSISIICTGEEITGQKAGERGNVVQLKEEPEQKEQKVIQASEATDASQIKSHFLAKMSREIKAPINDIMRSGAILKNSLSLEENQKKYVEIITKNSESILALINDVLDISKIAENEIKIEEIDFDLEYLVQSILTLLRPTVHDKPVDLYAAFEADMPTSFKGDPTRIRQVVLHLLRNAIRFTEKGEIAVNIGFDASDKKPADGATESIRTLRITIKDTGVGIPEDKQTIIHDIFNQTDMTMTTQYEVRWVGLTVTKHLIEMMGGTICVESEEGKGSEFIFTLHVKETVPITESLITPLHKHELQDKRIAVIEDLENPRRILDTYCKELGMKMLFYASSTNEALQLLDKEREPPDIILCDITMAGMDGCEITKKIKENEHYKKIKLVALNSYNIPGAAKITQALGFDAYLPKPIVKKDLIKVILTTLGDKREGGQIITRHMYEELALKGLKILVSEDNAVNQKSMEKLLKKLGCEIGTEWNGKETADKSEAQHYDLILMDIDRPEMDWRAAVKIIHKNCNGEIPIIALTSKSIPDLNDEGTSLPHKINDYLQKPVSIQSLKEKLLIWGKREG